MHTPPAHRVPGIRVLPHSSHERNRADSCVTDAVSRLCRTCEAPMARREDTCWRCGADWIYDDQGKRGALRVIPGGASMGRERGNTAVATQTELEAGRRAVEGGSPGVAAATSASATGR